VHFLLVDDDPALLTGLTDALHLRYENLEVSVKVCAADALTFLQTQPVDLVISDMLLSGMGGCRFAEELQRVTPRPPVILMTGAIRDDVEIPRAVSFIIRKPFSMRDLDTAIRTVLGDSAQSLLR